MSALTDGLTGIVIAGAGARGAYEIGALSMLLPALEAHGLRSRLFIGTSAGAINAALLGSLAHLSVDESMALALARWRQAGRGQVMKPVLPNLLEAGARFVAQFAGFDTPLTHLFDTSPQKETFEHWLDWEQLHRNLHLSENSVAVVTTSTTCGRTQVFAEGPAAELLPASDDERAIDYLRTTLQAEHIMASSAIPVAFAPVEIKHDDQTSGWHVDGGVRMNAPLKPAIAMRAQQLVIVATHPLSDAAQSKQSVTHHAPDVFASAADVLHAMLVDRMVEDVRTLDKINALVKQAAPSREPRPGKRPFRQIPYLFAGPTTRDQLGMLAADVYRYSFRRKRTRWTQPDFPILNRLIGGDEETNGELLSFLFFHPDFIDAAIEMGRQDAHALLGRAPGEIPWH